MKPIRTSTKGAHTPGPWEFYPARNYEGFAIAPKGIFPTLAAVERMGAGRISIESFNFPGETEANARLIASAPDLLEALERTLSWLTSYPGGGTMGPKGPYEQARAAITKATNGN